MESSSKQVAPKAARPGGTFYLGIRVTKRAYDAIVKMQQDSAIDVSLTAVVQHLLDKALGFEKTAQNGKKRRQ